MCCPNSQDRVRLNFEHIPLDYVQEVVEIRAACLIYMQLLDALLLLSVSALVFESIFSAYLRHAVLNLEGIFRLGVWHTLQRKE